MSILGWAVTALIPGGGIALAVLRFGKDAVLGSVNKAGSAVAGLPWAKIWWTIPVAASAIFGLVCLHREHKVEKQIPALEQQAANSHTAFMLEKKAFATEKASLTGAFAQIDASNKRVAAAGAEFARERAQATQDEARNAKLAQSTDARIAAVRASVPPKPCVLPDTARKALDGL